MFRCKDTPEFASDYLEGALAGRVKRRFRMHLLICRNCRRYLDQLRRTVDLAVRLPRERPDREAEAWLLEAVRRIHRADGAPHSPQA